MTDGSVFANDSGCFAIVASRLAIKSDDHLMKTKIPSCSLGALPTAILSLVMIAGMGERAGAALTDQLLSHLTFDQATYTNGGAANAGAAGAGGTVTGTVNSVAGKFGQAAGVATYGAGSIQLADDVFATIGTGSFSLSVWFQLTSRTSDPAFLSNKDWNSGGSAGVNFAFASNTTLDINTYGGSRVDWDSGVGAASHGGVPAFTVSTWANALLVVDRADTSAGANGTGTFYINGVAVARDVLPTGTGVAMPAGGFDGAFNLRVLNDGTGAYAGSTTSGLAVDDLAVWNRALTLSEIGQLQTAAIPEPSAALLGALGTLALLRRRRA